MLAHAGVPLTYWPYAFQSAVYVINRLTNPVLELESPYQVFYQKLPLYDSFKTFGCACFLCLRLYNSHKL